MWVGGSKPGRIEFLGETKFAPGEWAGVVLDEPVGKNDGSVGGVSYFKVIVIYVYIGAESSLLCHIQFHDFFFFEKSQLEKT